MWGVSGFLLQLNRLPRKKLAFMNNILTSQNIKINDNNGTHSNKIIRRVRESEPNLIMEDPLFACKKEKGNQHDLPKKLCKQPRLSEVLSSQYNNQYFHSPQHQIMGQVLRPGFHSPQYTKKAAMAKSLTSPCYDGEAQGKNSVAKNAISKAQNKNRKNPIQNHKEALSKIEEMLLNHGVKLPNSTKDKKTLEENGVKAVKASSYTKIRQKETLFQEKPKSRQSQKTSPRLKPQQSKEEANQLKQTVSTHCSYKGNRKMISEFEIGKQLGKGKFGVVKLVRHKKTGFLFSMKIIKKSVIQKEELINQLIKQTKIQQYMSQSGIVKLYTVFDDPENIYLLMELCCQGNLYQYMRKKGKIPESQTKVLVKSICQGLAELHNYNIIHRDLKPENIVLCYGMTKICDFGWSTQYKNVMRQTFCGTPLYVSPELLSGNCYDEKVDLWAIGVLTYEMLTGRIPFQIKSERDLSKIISTKIVYPATMSNEAISFLGDLLAKDPKNRKSISQILAHPFLETRKQPK